MKKRITKKTKRRLTFLSSIILLLVGVIISSVFKDMCQVFKNKNEIAILTDKYNTLLHEEESLQSEITKLQDEDYVARYAREKFLYSLPNEVIIKLPSERD